MSLSLITLSAVALLHQPVDTLPRRAPREVGMSAERLARIDHVVSRGVAAGGFPGAAVVVGRRGAVVWQRGYGRLDWSPEENQYVDARQTLYDLASLTKVVATTTAVMILADRGTLRLDAPVARYLPGFTGGGKELVTAEHLLTHRSGLPAGRELWRVARTPREARQHVLSVPLQHTPGTRTVYSDLGPDVLALLVEAVSGEHLDVFLAKRVFKPLGMRSTTFGPGPMLRDRVAPTEVSSVRGRLLRGEVHDENAYALGGVSGHAGLFSTASDLAVFAQMMLNGGEYNGTRIISDSTVRRFTYQGPGGRALGWNGCGGSGSCGQLLSRRSYGHTGYTGTSMWIDPDQGLFVIFLSNWAHPGPLRYDQSIAILSDVRADVADVAALAVIDDPAGPRDMPPQLRADRAVGWRARALHSDGAERRGIAPGPR